MTVRAELKELMCSNFDLRTYVPSEPDLFGFWIEVEIGVEGQSGADLFQLFVCSPRWLNREVREKGAMWEYARVVIPAYDYLDLRSFVAKTVGAVGGKDWQEVVAQLRLLARWEFEGYTAAAD